MRNSRLIAVYKCHKEKQACNFILSSYKYNLRVVKGVGGTENWAALGQIMR